MLGADGVKDGSGAGGVDVMDPELAEIRRRFDEISAGVWLGRALGVAAELGLADAIGDAPIAVDALAARLGLHEDALARLMRALAANGIFEEAAPGAYRQTAMSRFLRADHPFSLRGILGFMESPLHLDAWGGFARAIREGSSGFAHARGLPLFEHLRRAPDDAAQFNHAMQSYALQPAATIVAAHPAFRGARSLVDVGGGVGALAAAAVRAHPGLRATILDLPHVEAGAAAFLARAGAADRVTFTAGDFFASVPAGGDLYVLKSILWDWDDERCLRILGNVRAALGEGGRLLIIEHILTPAKRSWATLFDLLMLAMTSGGRARSDEEHRRLVERAGLRLESIVELANTSVATCVPA